MTEKVVYLEEISQDIVLIRMEDRNSRNTFSEALVSELLSAYESIEKNERWKVVIITGYDTYFATGGTKEGLNNLHEKKGKFTDINIYSLAMDCSVPVIAAMQGHGVGGGFVMGLFADIIILSRESIYTTNFMKYGFTPGMGATLVVPEKIGMVLGEEMLLTAATYHGEDLRMRGVPFQVIPRKEVLQKALDIAKSLSEMPRHSLVTLKKHLTASLRSRLAQAIKDELRMHEITFHQPEVKNLIEKNY